MKSDTQRVRRENLRRLLEKYSPTTLASILGHKGPSFISQMMSGRRPISEKTARTIEEKLGLEQWTLDAKPGEPTPFTGTSRELIAQVVVAVEKQLESFHGPIASERRAKLIAEVYEHSVPLGNVDLEYLKRLIQLLA